MSIPAPVWTPSNDEYHAMPGRWSSSRLAVFRRSPWEAYKRHVACELAASQASIPMQLGAAVVAALTEPPDAGTGPICVDVQSRNAKAYRVTSNAFPNRIVLTKPEFERVEAMVASFHSLDTPIAKAARALMLTAPGHYEYAHQWDDAIGGIPCMMKVDKLIQLDRATIVELKTAQDASPSGFAAAAWRHGYHCSAAFYCRGVEALLGIQPDFYYVVLHNEWPHEVAVYRAAEDFLELGKRSIEGSLVKLAACLRANSASAWRQDWELCEVIPTLHPPRWAAERDLEGINE